MTSATKTVVVAKVPGLTGGDYTLDVKSSNLELNEARTPYGRIQLTVALPESTVLAQITPYAALRIQGTVTHSWVTPTRASQTRTFDFLLHERTINHEDATLTLIGQTDEAMLIDRFNASTTLARTYGLSLKTAVDYALTQIGATLEAGAVDAALTSKTLEPVVTNLLTNPSIETNMTSWAATSGSHTIARVTTQHYSGAACLASTTVTAGNTGALLSSNEPAAVAGTTYSFAFYAKASVTRNVTASIRWLDAAKSFLSLTSSTAVAVGSSGWVRLTVTGMAPASTAYASVSFFMASAAIGDVLYSDAFYLGLSATIPDYFDGASTDPGLYSFAWTGTANASSSTKTNLPNTDATIWQPGQSLDKWLDPMLQAGNRRLFCDEHRKWRLVDGSYSIDGTLSVAEGFNAKSGTDTMSRQKTEQGRPTWFDHVAVHYSWKDAAGVSQEAWDFASSGSVKGYLVEFDTPWPGPGAATGILSRAAGRGRTQDITALTDYTGTPGIAIVTSLPGTPTQSGVLSSIAWRWDENADDMTVSSRGLINTPADAWIFAVGAWSAATGTWAGATGTN